jgi:hypothetical protein
MYLTFDFDDFINEETFDITIKILDELKKRKIKSLFFITGLVADKLKDKKYNNLVKMLSDHYIGYHGNGHTVRPTIQEFTDIEDYNEAVMKSYDIENSCMDPLTGNINGSGGFVTLSELFSEQKITCFRAPGFAWSPPHLEALKKMGVDKNFTYLNMKSFSVNSVNFVNHKTLLEPVGIMRPLKIKLSRLKPFDSSMVMFHPHRFVICDMSWDRIYEHGNPKIVQTTPLKNEADSKKWFSMFRKNLKYIRSAPDVNKIKIKPGTLTKDEINLIYDKTTKWTRSFLHYEPKYLKNHFYSFFNV